MALRIFIFLALALISPLAYAQGKDVQVNLEVLEHYAPPPMFGAEELLCSRCAGRRSCERGGGKEGPGAKRGKRSKYLINQSKS